MRGRDARDGGRYERRRRDGKRKNVVWVSGQRMETGRGGEKGRREADRMGERGGLFLCDVGRDVGRRFTVLCPPVHPPVRGGGVFSCGPWWVV